jgi:proteic killer suppression protein
VEISFETVKNSKLFNSADALNKHFGTTCARRIRTRLQQLEAAETLADMAFGRPHELKGDRAGQISFDLDHPLRLIARPSISPPPTLPDGGLDRRKVTSLTVIEVADTH